MKLTSPAFSDNGPIPAIYTCDGEDKNPALAIADVPNNAKTLVLVVKDPDSPSGDFVHWTMWNIPSETVQIGEDSVPAGVVEGITDFDKIGYGGPCPHKGIHRYMFTLYALDTALDLPSTAAKSDIEAAMNGRVLAKARLTGLYHRFQ